MKMTTMTTNKFEDLLETNRSMTRKPYTVLNHDSSPANDLLVQQAIGGQELMDSGRWDSIPALGIEDDIWFHVQSVQAQVSPPNERTREGGLRALDSADELADDTLWVNLVKPSRMEVFDYVNRCQPALVQESLAMSEARVSVASVQAVANALASYYLPNAGFTNLTFTQLSVASKVSIFTVRAAANVLSEAGLWGVIKGNGRIASRYYPLFVVESMEQFRELVQG